jgi:3-oxoacyl-[acyl-carrier protein] reductase
MELGISGRRAAVAAATSGLGLASATALAAEGVHVAICGRDPDRLADAAAAVGHGCVPIVADVSTPQGATSFVEQAADALGAVDILVPNAGGPPPGTFASTPVDAYSAALDLNLLSVVAMCKAAVPAMQERRWGRVVAITSLSVRQPIANLILSNTARAGATGFLKTLALEVAGDGVTVNSVQPGLHRTPGSPTCTTSSSRHRCGWATLPTSARSSRSCAASPPSSPQVCSCTSTAATTSGCSDGSLCHLSFRTRPEKTGCAATCPSGPDPKRQVFLDPTRKDRLDVTRRSGGVLRIRCEVVSGVDR